MAVLGKLANSDVLMRSLLITAGEIAAVLTYREISVLKQGNESHVS